MLGISQKPNHLGLHMRTTQEIIDADNIFLGADRRALPPRSISTSNFGEIRRLDNTKTKDAD